MSKNRGVLCLVGVLIAGTLVFGGTKQRSERALGPHAPGEILVKFSPRADGSDQARARTSLDARVVRSFRTGAQLWRLAPGLTVEKALDILGRNPGIEYAEPNYLLVEGAVPDDPLFPQQWGLVNTGQTGGTADADIDADLVWEDVTGSPGVIVAVLDHGIEYFHADLAGNTIPGWDFVEDDANPSPYDDDYKVPGGCMPGPVSDHGTHVAGIVGARGDNQTGISGVNWDVSILPVRIMPGAASHAIDGIGFAVSQGADVINASFQTGGFSQALLDAIQDAGDQGVVFVAAAMNNFSTGGKDNDINPTYPAGYLADNVIAVAGSDPDDGLVPSSNYGYQSVDLAAPGEDILSTIATLDSYCDGDPIVGPPRYAEATGTSLATPHVTGAVALMRALDPSATVAEIKCSLLTSVDIRPSLVFRTLTGGRLNARAAVDRLLSGEPCVLPTNFRFPTKIYGSPNPSYEQINLLSLPYGNPYQGPGGSEALCNALDLSNNATVTQYDGLGGKLTHDCGSHSTEFELLPLKGVEIIERHPSIREGFIEGWDDPQAQVVIEDLGPGNVGRNLFPVRFNGTAVTPEDLCTQCALSSQASVTRFDAETGGVQTHVCGQLPLWNLVLGESVLIQEPNGPVTCQQPHF